MIILLQRKRVIEQYTNEIYYLHLSLDFSEKNNITIAIAEFLCSLYI